MNNLKINRFKKLCITASSLGISLLEAHKKKREVFIKYTFLSCEFKQQAYIFISEFLSVTVFIELPKHLRVAFTLNSLFDWNLKQITSFKLNCLHTRKFCISYKIKDVKNKIDVRLKEM